MRHTDRPPLRSLLTDRLGEVGIRSGQILLVVILAALVVYALIQLKLVVIPLLIALILAAAASPVVSWLRRHGMPALAATWITLIAGVVALGGVIWLVVIAVQNQWDELSQSVSDGLKQIQEFLATTPLAIDQSQLESIRSSIVDFLTSSQFGTGALAGVSAATQVITGILLGVVILFYFLKDGDQIWNFFLRPFHGKRLRRGQRIGRTGVKVLGEYVRGTAIIAFVDAAGIGIGLLILQIPLALPLAVIVFLGGFIPLIGATIAGVLAVLVALVSNGPVAALILAAVVIGVQQLEGDLLQPVVMARSLKLHPLVILVALTAGTILGGIIGAVIAVPLCAVTWAIIKVWNSPAESGPADDGTDEDGMDASSTGAVGSRTVETGTVETGTVETGTVETGTVETGTVETGTVRRRAEPTDR
jgi:predicted PurR-regulated permease PerM